VNVTFTIKEGPKVKIRDMEWVGNVAYGDGTLTRKMKENKPKGMLGFITGGGTYQEAKLEEDFASSTIGTRATSASESDSRS
jgi:outer membrane protein insertion porin family